MNNLKYAQFARNEYSQFGEDGIIEQMLQRLPNRDKWCVEFGAWDGIYLSNTYNLIKSSGYRPVLIEANKRRFQTLTENMAQYDATLVNEFVTFDGSNTLDKILGRTSIPKDFDFLSIDIDGNDYWIFDSLKEYRPKVVCIEYNPTIPNEVEYIQPRDFSVKFGSSAKAFCKLAENKSYSLIATTRCNLLFVDKFYFHLFDVQNNRLEDLRDDSEVRVFVFSGYDGTIQLSQPLNLMWHDYKLNLSELQSIPKMLRSFPSEYGYSKKILFMIFLFYRAPREASIRIWGKLKQLIFSARN